METLRFRNYRCFEDTGEVEIRPITALIGANSSGKSSFLKFFPLMKQSMGEMVNGVFLWSGPLVDLKDFDNTVRTDQQKIVINYTIENLPYRRPVLASRWSFKNVNIELHLAKRDDVFDYLQKLLVKSKELSLEVECFPDHTAKVSYNTIVSTEFAEDVNWDINTALIPKLYYNRNKREGFDEYSRHAREDIIRPLKDLCIEEENWRYFLASYRENIFNRKEMRQSLLKYKNIDLREDNYEHLIDLIQYYHINNLVDSINYYFLYMAKKMTYVKPLRAIAERYYRFQNYSVQEIDSDGKNLPMFFNSLSREAFANLNMWLGNIFGFSLNLRADSGHLEMLIKESKSSVARNLTDLGFGYTQMLPILTILWKVIMVDCINGEDESYDYCKMHIVAIEQPELHLHPRYQGLFVDMMAKVIEESKKEKKDIRIIIETHSEIIINRLGKLIANNGSGLSEQDVNVVIFNGLKERLNSYVVQTKYDSAGYIVDWPYGFFSDYVDRDNKERHKRSTEEKSSKTE